MMKKLLTYGLGVAVGLGWLGVSMWLTPLPAAYAQSQKCFPEITCRVTEPPKVEVIASGGTITVNACGSVKPVSAAGAVTTDTTNTFENPGKGNAGCIMAVCNVGSQTITLDDNALFDAGGNVSLTANSCIMVGSTGSVWYRLSGVVNN